MKKLLFFLIIISFIGCSTFNEEKAKNLVKKYLKGTLDNPKSYDPVSWSELDSLINVLEEDSYYIIKTGELSFLKREISLKEELLNGTKSRNSTRDSYI